MNPTPDPAAVVASPADGAPPHAGDTDPGPARDTRPAPPAYGPGRPARARPGADTAPDTDAGTPDPAPDPGRVPPNTESAPHAAPGAARYGALRRELTGDGWTLTGPTPAPQDAGVVVYTLTAPGRAAQGGLTGEAAVAARLRRVRLVVPTRVGYTCVKLVQGDAGRPAWQAVADGEPDPAVLLAAARAAASALPGTEVADSRTTGRVLTRRGWFHAETITSGYACSHLYISPADVDCALQATFLPPTGLSRHMWRVIPEGAGRITTVGPVPAAVVNALLLTPADPALAAHAPDSRTGC